MNWVELLTVFLRAVFLSVNGSTTLALLHDDLVDRLHRLSPADFATGVAVGAISPGPLGYGCIALGFLAYGWPGALVATFTSWLPAFLSLPICRGYRQLQHHPWFTGFTWGVAAAGTGLFLALAWSLAQPAFASLGDGELRPAAIVVGTVVLLARRVPAAMVLALAAFVGAVFLR